MPTANRIILGSSQPDLRLLERLGLVQGVCLALAAMIAVPVLGGWLIPGVAALLPYGWSDMKPNSAAGMLLGAASLALSGSRQGDRALPLIRVLAVALLLMTGSALFEHLGGRITGIDTFLAADAGADNPGLMSLQTSIFLLLLGMSVSFARARKNALAVFVDTLTVGLLVVAVVVLAGYCFGATRLFGQSSFTSSSSQTVLCMALLAFVAVGRRTEYGYLSVLVGAGIGSQISRAILPVALLLPFLLEAGGAYATNTGMLAAPYAAALIAAITAIALFGLGILMAWRINDLERDLRQMSLTDDLTGAFNARGFHVLGEQALLHVRRAGIALTVLYFDIDGLKDVNDAFGHDVGSQLVRDVAGLLRKTFRSADIVARVGGDEFAVVTHGDSASAAIALARVEQAAAAMNRARGRPYLISFSAGQASSDPAAQESFADLVARADAEMYEHKRARRASRRAA